MYYSGQSAFEDLEAAVNGQVPKLLPVTEETPQFKNISIKNVNCKGAMLGLQLQGLPELNLENVVLENIQIEADQGMVCSDVKNLKVMNLTIITEKTPVVDFKNCKDVFVDGLFTPVNVFPLIQIAGLSSGKTVMKNTGITDYEKQIVIGKEVPKNIIEIEK